MATCVSMKCPFILYCKHYNFTVDRTGGCEVQKQILGAAKELIDKQEGRKRVYHNG